MGGWIVARTKVHSESRAVINLSRQAFYVYFPKLIENRKGVRVEKPLFSRYLFIWVKDIWRPILGTYGVSSIIMNGDRPAIIACDEIDYLRSLENSDGFVVLPRSFEEKFKKGDRLKIVNNVFSGSYGLYDGMTSESRVIVLLSIFGRHSKVEVDINDVAIAK